MWKILGISFLLLEVFDIVNAAIPNYLKPCSKTKDFKTCAVQHGNEAIPFLLQGDKNYQIPELVPLKIPKVELDTGANLKIKFTDVNLYGLDTGSLVDMDVDFSSNEAYLDINLKHVELIGTYDIDGKIMVLPIKGHGPMNISGENCNFKYTFKYKLEPKDGVQYAVIQDGDTLEFKIQKAHFQLDNLFEGNQAMGDNVNKFLNENDQDVLQEIGGAIKGTIMAVIKHVSGGLLNNIPFDELFLP